MEIIKKKDFNKFNSPGTIIAIGSFDGIHQGHQKIINKTISSASEKNLYSGVFTFEPHPQEVISPENKPEYLTSKNQKISFLEQMGLDYYFEQEFTKKFSQINFEDFISKILVSQLGLKEIVVGNDFRFGYNGKGNIDKLKSLANKYDFQVNVVSPYKLKGKKVSSTRIRNLVKKGKIDMVNSCLGRPYCLEGEVVRGEGLGKRIGFPTANLDLITSYVLPPRGVYIGYAYIDDNKYKAITNFGSRPTFSGRIYTIEVHLIDFNENIYGDTISVELLEFLREEMNFKSTSELIEQIEEDILYTEQHLC